MTPVLVRTLIGVCATAVMGSAVAQPASADFDLRLPLRTAGDGLHVIELPEAVYRAAQTPDLSDLRILNARNEMLPFAFIPAPSPAWSTSAAVDLRIAALPSEAEARDSLLRTYALRVERDRERALIEIEPSTNPTAEPSIGGYLIDARSLKDLRGKLLLSFVTGASDYASRVDVLGSDDLVNWQRLTSGPLTHNRSLGDVIERNAFELNRPPAFLRIAWRSADAPAVERAQFVEHVAPNIALPRATLATTLSEDRHSLYVDVPEALPITRVFARVPELNRVVRAQVYWHVDSPEPRPRRRVLGPRRAHDNWQPMGPIEAFRLLREGVEVEGAPLTYAARTERLRLDFPSALDGAPPVIEAGYRPARVVFVARAPGPFVLAVGQRDLQAGQRLNATAILAADDPSGQRLPVATVDKTIVTGTSNAERAQRIAESARWSRHALWAVLALAVVGLSWMAWRLSVQLRTPPEDRNTTEATAESKTAGG